MEETCNFVSSRGILKSCDIHNITINSSDSRLDIENYLKIKKNDIVYVNTSALSNFFTNIYIHIQEPFILVSGDSDVSIDTYV
jgi:hypothetical protein